MLWEVKSKLNLYSCDYIASENTKTKEPIGEIQESTSLVDIFNTS